MAVLKLDELLQMAQWGPATGAWRDRVNRSKAGEVTDEIDNGGDKLLASALLSVQHYRLLGDKLSARLREIDGDQRFSAVGKAQAVREAAAAFEADLQKLRSGRASKVKAAFDQKRSEMVVKLGGAATITDPTDKLAALMALNMLAQHRGLRLGDPLAMLPVYVEAVEQGQAEVARVLEFGGRTYGLGVGAADADAHRERLLDAMVETDPSAEGFRHLRDAWGEVERHDGVVAGMIAAAATAEAPAQAGQRRGGGGTIRLSDGRTVDADSGAVSGQQAAE